jgi:biotin synthase
MSFEKPFNNIIENISKGKGPDKEECKYLLGFEPHSQESTFMMSVANNICRSKLNNSGVIYAQIAIDVAPCTANCEFCSFSAEYTDIKPHRMSMSEIAEAVKTLSKEGDLFGIFLMTMENVDIGYIIDAVKTTRESLASYAQIWINIGDITLNQAKKLKDAGVDGAYHVIRLREGVDTLLNPDERIESFDAIREAGLQLYTCCEPIGPEHSAEEIFNRVFLNYKYGLVQQSAMRRTYIPSLPISKRGLISQLRLAQITAIITLSSVSYPDIIATACHEPNLLGLVSGSNITSAEWGANPRDDTREGTNDNIEKRGLTMNDCRRMLFEAGYSSIVTSDFREIPLNEEYLVKVGAF